MKKKFRFVISLILTFMLFNTIVFGIEKEPEIPLSNERVISETVTNEFVEANKNFAKQKNNAEFIHELKNIEQEKQEWNNRFQEHIKKLNDNYTDIELKKIFNYNDSQIKAIRNYDGSEEMSILASAQYNSELSLVNYYHITNTYLTIRYTTTISGASLNPNNNVALAIGGSEANYFHNASSLRATYSSVDGSQVRDITNKEITSGTGVVFGFNSGFIDYDPNSHTYVEYNLTRTIAEYTGIAGGRVTVSGISAAFARTQISFSFGFGLGFGKDGVGFSITPETRWNIVNDDDDTVTL